jgi:hypothetical protein
MTRRTADKRLDVGALRGGIDRRDPDRLIGLYAEHAHLSIVNAGVPQTSPFELRGKAEIAKHLRATFLPKTSRRVEKEEVVGQKSGVKCRKVCEYSDRDRVVVQTTLRCAEARSSARWTWWSGRRGRIAREIGQSLRPQCTL